MEKKRLIGLDIVRTAAILFVIVLHSTSLSGVFDGERDVVWHICLYLRQLCLSCVPLFLILSGYLQKNKKPSISYYVGIIPLYLSYAAISAICMLAYAVHGYINGNMDLTLVTAVYKILDFSANGYAWYFEMFLGLFLLIPFLNLLYCGIKTKKGKLALIATLAFLTLLPDTLSGFAPSYSGASTVTLNILPDFFKSLYPITYYYIGSYIAEYRPRLSVSKRLVLALGAPLVQTAFVAAFTYIRNGYAWYMLNGFQTVTVALTASCVFLSLYDVDLKSIASGKVFACISTHTFEMYLFSYLFDNFFYTTSLGSHLPAMIKPALVFVCSFAAAFVLMLVLRPLARVLVKVIGRHLSAEEI